MLNLISCPLGCRTSQIQDWHHYCLHILGQHNPGVNSMEMQRMQKAGITLRFVMALSTACDFKADMKAPLLVLRAEQWCKQVAGATTYEDLYIPRILVAPPEAHVEHVKICNYGPDHSFEV